MVGHCRKKRTEVNTITHLFVFIVFNANIMRPVACSCVAVQNASVCSTYLLGWRIDFRVTERLDRMTTNYYSERMWEKKIVAFLTVLPQYLPCETKQKGIKHL